MTAPFAAASVTFPSRLVQPMSDDNFVAIGWDGEPISVESSGQNLLSKLQIQTLVPDHWL
jgi:hypothetical protein